MIASFPASKNPNATIDGAGRLFADEQKIAEGCRQAVYCGKFQALFFIIEEQLQQAIDPRVNITNVFASRLFATSGCLFYEEATSGYFRYFQMPALIYGPSNWTQIETDQFFRNLNITDVVDIQGCHPLLFVLVKTGEMIVVTTTTSRHFAFNKYKIRNFKLTNNLPEDCVTLSIREFSGMEHELICLGPARVSFSERDIKKINRPKCTGRALQWWEKVPANSEILYLDFRGNNLWAFNEDSLLSTNQSSYYGYQRMYNFGKMKMQKIGRGGYVGLVTGKADTLYFLNLHSPEPPVRILSEYMEIKVKQLSIQSNISFFATVGGEVFAAVCVGLRGLRGLEFARCPSLLIHSNYSLFIVKGNMIFIYCEVSHDFFYNLDRDFRLVRTICTKKQIKRLWHISGQNDGFRRQKEFFIVSESSREFSMHEIDLLGGVSISKQINIPKKMKLTNINIAVAEFNLFVRLLNKEWVAVTKLSSIQKEGVQTSWRGIPIQCPYAELEHDHCAVRDWEVDGAEFSFERVPQFGKYEIRRIFRDSLGRVYIAGRNWVKKIEF